MSATAIVAFFAVLDLIRRLAVLAFKLARFLGLGRLRDAEAALLRRLAVEELVAGAALCIVALSDSAGAGGLFFGDASSGGRRPQRPAPPPQSAAAPGGPAQQQQQQQGGGPPHHSPPPPPPASRHDEDSLVSLAASSQGDSVPLGMGGVPDPGAAAAALWVACAGAIFAALASSCVGLLSRLARARLAHLVSTPCAPAAFWSRALEHARLFVLLLATEMLVISVAASIVADAYRSRGLFAALQLVALAARAGKRTTQALAHHLALAYYELGPSVRRAASRIRARALGARAERARRAANGARSPDLLFWFNADHAHRSVFEPLTRSLSKLLARTTRQAALPPPPTGAGRRRRRLAEHRRPTRRERAAAFGVATYYIEYLTDCLELSLVLVWYALELCSGAARFSTGSVLFSVFAQQAHSRLRARVAFHSEWLKARKALQTHRLFRIATQADLDHYDDVCVVCMDDLRLPAAPTAGTPQRTCPRAPPSSPPHSPPEQEEGRQHSHDDDDAAEEPPPPRSTDGEEALPPDDSAQTPPPHHHPPERPARNTSPVKLPCGHILHLSCLQLYVDTSHSRSTNLECPVCRAPLTEPASAHASPQQQPGPAGAAADPPAQDHDHQE